jgi:periplasmic mercuric ion binding protein
MINFRKKQNRNKMKKSIVSLVILIMTLSVNVTAQSKSKKVVIKTKVYCDHCTKCESCKARVENKVFDLKGIKQVDMNAASQTITVVYNAKKVSLDQIKKQIATTGYDADDVQATTEQVAGLDDCCKKQ